MRKLVMFAAASAMMGVCGAASAADLGGYKDDDVRAPGFSWSGFYLGGHGGGGWGNSSWNWDDLPNQNSSSSPSGGLGGVQAGYNLQIARNIVLGLEGSLSWGSLEDTVTPPAGGWAQTTEVTWLGDISLRAGYALDRTLLFVKTGVAWGGFEHSGVDWGGHEFSAATDNQVGWLIGGGAEFALTHNWSVKVEYNYIDFFDNGSFAMPHHSHSHEIGADQSVSVVKAGINYRLGGNFSPLK